MTNSIYDPILPSELPFWFVHCWVSFILINFFVSFFAWKIRANIFFDKKNELGYKKTFWIVVSCMNIPWILMGAGIVFGGVGSVFDYAAFWQGKPVVTTWWIGIFLLALGTAFWMNNGGAEKLAQWPFLPAVPIGNPAKIKKTTVLLVLMVPIFITLMGDARTLGLWSAYHPKWAILALSSLVLGVVGFVALAVWLGLQIGEWPALAEHYKASQRFKGKLIRSQKHRWISMDLGTLIYWGSRPVFI